MNVARMIGRGLISSLALLAACGDGPETAAGPRESVRDSRYCEFATLFFGPDGITSDSWNTGGLNDCPADDWEEMDFEAVREELGATVLRPNGPRRWAFDAVALQGSEEAERRFFGGIEFRFVANVQYDFVLPPPGTYFFEARVKRDSRFLHYKGLPIYELIAPLGKRYVMQSYARYVDTDLTIEDLDTLESRIDLPDGWRYRVRVVEEDFVSEDFQGFATGMRDPLENTYQRAELLEYLPAERVFVDLFNPTTRETWSAILTRDEADQLQIGAPWQRNDRVTIADKSVYARSPGAEIDGRFEAMSLGGFSFYQSERVLTEPVLDASGQLRVGESQKFHELTYGPERAIPYLTSGGEVYVLVSEPPGAPDALAALPAGWNRGEVELADDWRILFEGPMTTIETVEDGRIYQGPVALPAGGNS